MNFMRARAYSGLLIGVLFSLMLTPAHAERTIEGRVTVVRDVDTIVVAGTAVRLQGLDGPETSTRAGQEARNFMVRLVRGKTVTCGLDGTRTYDRWVGICHLDGQDIAAIAVANGHALDCGRYSGGRYSDLETRAAQSRIRRAGYC
jgi:endonuclease YncB( thermonuclease family)